MRLEAAIEPLPNSQWRAVIVVQINRLYRAGGVGFSQQVPSEVVVINRCAEVSGGIPQRFLHTLMLVVI